MTGSHMLSSARHFRLFSLTESLSELKCVFICRICVFCIWSGQSGTLKGCHCSSRKYYFQLAASFVFFKIWKCNMRQPYSISESLLCNSSPLAVPLYPPSREMKLHRWQLRYIEPPCGWNGKCTTPMTAPGQWWWCRFTREVYLFVCLFLWVINSFHYSLIMSSVQSIITVHSQGFPQE